MAWARAIRTDPRRFAVPGKPAEYQSWVWITCVLQTAGAPCELSCCWAISLLHGKAIC